MKQVRLAYGRDGLEVHLPDSAEVIMPGQILGLEEETEAIREALQNPIGSPPLAKMVTPNSKVLVTHSDITRATPNDRILPTLLEELEILGVQRENITLLNGLGTHRPQTDAELRTMLGDYIVENYTCLQHDAFNDEILVPVGVTSRGNPARLNNLLLVADLVILTGFIEPHLFAGFSGGPKGILPALAGFESVESNHNATMIGHPKATFGITQGNPIWEEMLEIALMVPRLFILNVTLNAARQITGVFAGDLRAAHQEGVDFVHQTAMVSVPEPFDIVLTTNSGYPLDLNLYQGVKGISAAARIVRPGGAILMAAACSEGLPSGSGYANFLAQVKSPEQALEKLFSPGFSAPDQWNVQIQAVIQQKADVYLFSEGLTEAEIRSALLIPCKDIEADLPGLVKRYGPRICALPEGPQTIASVQPS